MQYIREARAHNVTDIVRVCEPSYSAKEVEAAGIRLHVRRFRCLSVYLCPVPPGAGLWAPCDLPPPTTSNPTHPKPPKFPKQEMSYEDGASPPPDVIDRWLALVDEVFYKPQLSHTASGLAAAATAAARRSSSSTASNGSQPGGSSAAAAGNGGAATTDPTAAAATSSTNSPQQHHQGLGAPAAASSTIAVHCVAGLGRAPVLVALALIEHGFGDPSAVVEFIRSQRRGAINMRQLNYLESYQRRSGSSCGACAIM